MFKPNCILDHSLIYELHEFLNLAYQVEWIGKQGTFLYPVSEPPPAPPNLNLLKEYLLYNSSG